MKQIRTARRTFAALVTLLTAVGVTALAASPAAAADPLLSLNSGLHLDAALASLISVK